MSETREGEEFIRAMLLHVVRLGAAGKAEDCQLLARRIRAHAKVTHPHGAAFTDGFRDALDAIILAHPTPSVLR